MIVFFNLRLFNFFQYILFLEGVLRVNVILVHKSMLLFTAFIFMIRAIICRLSWCVFIITRTLRCLEISCVFSPLGTLESC